MSWNESVWFGFFTSAALKSTVVMGAAWLLMFFLPRRPAAAKHLVWTAAFAALLGLPLLSVALPALRVPVSLPPGVTFQVNAVARATSGASSVAILGGVTSAGQRVLDWRLWLIGLWGAGVAVSMTQILVAWAAIWRVRGLSPRFNDMTLLLPSGVNVWTTAPGTMPITCGIFRPSIFLPEDARDWSEERRRVVLLHELAHIRRGDPATHLLARIALSLYWWNPIVWTAWREFLKERERAADDLVLGSGARASEYADHLLEIARTMQSAQAIGWAAVAMARRSQLEGRLIAILDAGIAREGLSRKWVWATALAALVLMAPFAALRAQDDARMIPADVDATIRAAAAQKNHQMLDAAAGAALAFAQYDLARKLLDSSLAIAGEVSGEQSVAYGQGLLRLGDLERNRNNFDEAEAFYTKAVSVLGDRPEAAPALIDLGTAALRKKDTQTAIEYFQRAQAADPIHPATATMWLAVVREQQQSLDEADSLYRQALASQDQKAAPAATTMELYAQFLRRQGRTDEASALADQAAALRREQGAAAPMFRQATGQEALRMGQPGMTPPRLAYKVEPEYTEEARMAKYQGTVLVSAVVGVDGTAQDMKVVRGLGLGLDQKAVQAISKWKFNPGTLNGQPVPVVAQIEVNFRLL
jgi:TonB family protein